MVCLIPFRAVLAAILVVIHLFFLWNTRDLEQVNRDELFLDKNHYQSFKLFQEKVHDAPLIVMDISGPKNISEIKNQILERIDELTKQGPQVRTFFDIYKRKVNKQNFDQAVEFSRQTKDLTFPFLGPNHLTALIILPKEWSWSQNHQMVEHVTKSFQFEGFETSFTGTPYINYQLNIKSQAIKQEIFPILFALCFLLSFLIIGELRGAILVFVPSLFAAATTLFLSKLMFQEMNMITSIIPVLNFILNLTLGYHIYCTYIKERSIAKVFTRKLAPILLMISTTAIGFGSLYFSHIEAIRQMSLTSSIGLIITCLIHMLWSWLTYDIVNQKKPLTLSSKGEILVIKVTGLMNPKIIFFSGLVMGIIGIFMANNIQVMTEAAHYFQDHSHIKEKMERIHNERIGNPNFEILVNYGEDEQDFEHLKKIWNWENELKVLLPQHKILSMNQFVAEANFLYSGDKKIPDQAMAYSLLRSGVDPELSQSFMNESVYRLTMTGPFLDNAQYLELEKKIENFLQKNQIPAQMGGLYYTLRKSQNSLIWVLVQSFSLSLFIILILAYIHFRNISILLSFTLANIIPAMTALLFMYITGLTLNVATVMTFSITIGIIVDGSFHIAHAISKNESETELLRESLIPIFMSSAILILSFLVLGFYDFLPIRHFGLTLALNITLGLIFDLKVLPWLMRRKHKVA